MPDKPPERKHICSTDEGCGQSVEWANFSREAQLCVTCVHRVAAKYSVPKEYVSHVLSAKMNLGFYERKVQGFDTPSLTEVQKVRMLICAFTELPGASEIELRGGKKIAGAMTSEIPSVEEQKRINAEINARMGK